MKRLFLFLVAIPVLAANSWSATIVYIFTATASGTLGPDTFTNAQMTMTATANTESIYTLDQALRVTSVPNERLIVTISGLGEATFTVPTETRLNLRDNPSDLDRVFLTALAPPTAIGMLIVDADTGPSSLFSYSLDQPSGPVDGSNILNGNPVMTTAGAFDLNSGMNQVFRAVLVPEPGCSLLLGFGITAYAAGARRRVRG